MTIRAQSLSKQEAYALLSSAITPRPIALVTTLGVRGVVNAAPFSFFNALCSDPPLVMLSIDRRRGERKDTSRNILESREFVINIVSEAIAEKMNLCSGDYPSDVSEMDVAAFTAMPSEFISVPRIAESPVTLECRLHTHLQVGKSPNDLFIGEVLAFHVEEALLEAGRIKAQLLKAVGRLSGAEYCTCTDIFRMERPKIGRGA
jgi:flavin reductase (DIM6/NTAB) family NADH-FMN oxidoreductase RutF